MIRYSKVFPKNPREIVLLKSRPCNWGRCFFCDYIEDNSTCESEIINFNKNVLKSITGEFKSLEVINSASVFELPMENLLDIKDIVLEKGIDKIFFEAHYSYKDRLAEIENLFHPKEVIFKCGIETFDDDFRNKYLNKAAYFKDYREVREHFKSICLLIGIKGQTKEMIRKDMDILIHNFPYGCINIFMENSTPVKRDEDLIKWFKSHYSFLETYENIELLFNNTDFGVGK